MKRLSDLFRAGRAKYPRVTMDLVRIDLQGEIIGACALGCMGLELGMTASELRPAWTEDENGYTKSSEVGTKLDEWLGCKVMQREAGTYSSAKVFNHFFIMNDEGASDEHLAAALDAWQDQFCGGNDGEV